MGRRVCVCVCDFSLPLRLIHPVCSIVRQNVNTSYLLDEWGHLWGCFRCCVYVDPTECPSTAWVRLWGFHYRDINANNAPVLGCLWSIRTIFPPDCVLSTQSRHTHSGPFSGLIHFSYIEAAQLLFTGYQREQDSDEMLAGFCQYQA